jgi:hypothetical protein
MCEEGVCGVCGGEGEVVAVGRFDWIVVKTGHRMVKANTNTTRSEINVQIVTHVGSEC